jgi:protein SCO1
MKVTTTIRMERLFGPTGFKRCIGAGGVYPRSTWAVALVFFLFISLFSFDTHAQGTPDSKADPYLNVNVHLYDLELLTQEGNRVKFKSDVIGDKVVAMTFIYTTCTTICPIYNAIFGQLQPMLGERLGREVIMVSITLDPTKDVPRRMKREAEKFKAKPGWIYLTGEKQNVDQVLKGLGAYFPDFAEHPPMALVGDGKTGTWKRFNGFPRPEQLLAMIDDLLAARGEGG